MAYLVIVRELYLPEIFLEITDMSAHPDTAIKEHKIPGSETDAPCPMIRYTPIIDSASPATFSFVNFSLRIKTAITLIKTGFRELIRDAIEEPAYLVPKS